MTNPFLKIFLMTICYYFLSGCTLGEKSENILKLDCDIYLKIVRWGFDNQRTYISSNSDIQDTINEPYYKVLDFFYKVENCNLMIYKADSLNRQQLLNPAINIQESWGNDVNFENYQSLGFNNILYQ